MTYTTFTVERFGGLDLRDDPDEVGANAPVSVLDTDITALGTIGPRPGWKKWIDPGLDDQNHINFLYGLPANNILLTSDTNLTVATWSAAGALLASGTLGLLTAAVDIATESQTAGTYAVGNGSALFIDSAGNITIPTWVGKTPTGDCVSAWKTRLVFNDGNDRLYFSNAGDPLTVTYASGPPETGDFVDLDPRNSQAIKKIVTWRELMFVFKRTAMYVFYDTAELSDGTAEFLYRPVTNIPAVDFGQQSVAVGRDGVYYVNRAGVWVTTGGPPVKISTPIDPIFEAIPDHSSAPPNKSRPAADAAPVVHWTHDRLYIAYPIDTSGNSRVAVWDQTTGTWTIWSSGGQGITALCTQPTGSNSSYVDVLLGATLNVHGGITQGTFSVIRTLTDVTDFQDDIVGGNSRSVGSTSVAWSYQSGYYAPANGQRVKLRGSSVWGTGTVNLQMLTLGARTNDVVDPGGSLTLGTSPTVAEAKRRRACRGVQFAHLITGSGPGTVNRISHRFLPPGYDA